MSPFLVAWPIKEKSVQSEFLVSVQSRLKLLIHSMLIDLHCNIVALNKAISIHMISNAFIYWFYNRSNTVVYEVVYLAKSFIITELRN